MSETSPRVILGSGGSYNLQSLCEGASQGLISELCAGLFFQPSLGRTIPGSTHSNVRSSVRSIMDDEGSRFGTRVNSSA
jgi:hypothetical protein